LVVVFSETQAVLTEDFWRFSSVPLGKFRISASNRPQSLPSKSLPSHHLSFIIQPPDAVWLVDLLVPVQGPRWLSRYSDGLRTGWRGVSYRQGKDFSLLHVVRTGSGAHAPSYPMLFPRG
jgi:hypothetical protein